MKSFSTLVVLLATVAWLQTPALARSSFIIDGAGMFGASTVSALNTRLTNFNAQTHKEVVVETVPSLSGATLTDAAQREFAQQQVNGVLIFIAKDDRRDIIVPDHAGVQAGWFDADTLRSIRQSMEAQFKDGDFDGGITTAVSGVLGIYRSHMSSLAGASGAAPLATRSSSQNPALTGTPGFHLNGFWLIVILIVAFLVLRSLMRAMSAPRPSLGVPGAPGAAPGPPAPGYYGGGGGGFWSGLLGGLGGAWLGNEMFRGRGGDGGGGASAGGWGGDSAGGGAAPDAGGWSSDAGQADIGGSSGGDWSGGGFGGGDSGGGFGGGDGGGGGDSGGGW